MCVCMCTQSLHSKISNYMQNAYAGPHGNSNTYRGQVKMLTISCSEAVQFRIWDFICGGSADCSVCALWLDRECKWKLLATRLHLDCTLEMDSSWSPCRQRRTQLSFCQRKPASDLVRLVIPKDANMGRSFNWKCECTRAKLNYCQDY